MLIITPPPIINTQGFTLVEFILVILLMSIISIAILPQWTATTLNVEFEARRILNDIRYTQALSMATGQRYRWVRTSATTYQIINSAGTALILPSGSTQATLTSNVSFGAFTNLPNNLIAFDSTGTPYTDTGSPGTPLAATAIIPAVIGSNTRSIQVTPSTGYGALQ